MGILNRFPSVDQLFKGAVSTFVRFPLSLISAVFLTYFLINMAGATRDTYKFTQHEFLMVFSLGMLLFTSISLWCEGKKLGNHFRLGYHAIGIILLVGYYFSLPEDPFDIKSQEYRWTLFAIGLGCSLLFLPFLERGQINQFWKFSTILLLCFLMAAFYAVVLFGGLAIALWAVENLFGLQVKGFRYAQLWIIIGVLLSTWIFLAGVPKNLNDIRVDATYPRKLKIFTQYILLPLIGLYFLILISYELKIIFTWNWPIGWVSKLVMGYSAIGVFAILLLHPLRDARENRWIQLFMQWFFVTLVPFVIMFSLAISRRIFDYGITVNRYFVLLTAVGLSLLVLYFLFSKIKDIRLIPIAICCGALLSSFGPWGAFSVSERSQRARLEKLMVANAILKEGQIQKAPEIPTFEDRKEISSTVHYLILTHSLNSISPWLSDSMLVSLETTHRYNQSKEITKAIGFKYVTYWQTEESDTYIHLGVEKDRYIDISHFDQLMEFGFNGSDSVPEEYALDSDSIKIWVNNERAVMEMHYKSETNAIVLDFPLMERLIRIDSLYDENNVPIEEMTFSSSKEDTDFKIILQYATLRKNADSITIGGVRGYLLIRRR